MSVVKAPADTCDAAASDTPQRAFGPRDVLIGGAGRDDRPHCAAVAAAWH